jgi:hypothetical protein
MSDIEDLIRPIRMGLHGAPGFVLVEGPSDKALMKRVLDDSIVVVIAGGKGPLYAIAERMLEHPTVIGLADPDHDRLLGKPAPANVLHWDYCDAEASCFFHGGLEFVTDSYCSSNKVRTFCESEGRSLEQALLKRLEVVGALRFINSRDQLNLPFSEVPITGVTNKQNLEVDATKWMRAVVARTDHPQSMVADLIPAAEAIAASQPAEHLVRGHDLAAVMAVGARSRLGSRGASAKELTVGIEIALRGSLQTSTLRKTALGDEILKAEKSLGIKLLAPS